MNLALILAATGVAFALDGSERVRVELVAGGTVDGWFHSADEDTLTISADGGPVDVPIALIEHAWINDTSVPTDVLRADLDSWQIAQAPPGRSPPPWAAATSSALIPGAGHALLGEWPEALGYLVVDALVVGGAAYFIFIERSPGPALPLIGVDLVLRSYSAIESTGRARRRRSQLTATPIHGGAAVGLQGEF